MSKKPGLAALKAQIDGERRPPTPTTVGGQEDVGSHSSTAEGRVIRGRTYPTYREGKVPIGGYFSPELQRALHQLALDESQPGQPRVKIQGLLGEAIDLLLRDRGKSTFGER